jgi:hypothetical protein
MKWHLILKDWLGPSMADSALNFLQALGPAASAGLWVLQPSLGLVIPRQDIANWAHHLEQAETWEAWRKDLGEADE